MVGAPVCDAPFDYTFVYGANAMRVRDHHGPFKESGFGNPCRTCHLAVAVEREPAGKRERINRAASSWQDCRNAGPNRTAVRKIVDQCHLPYGYAGDVGNSIVCTRLPIEGNPEITGSGLGGTGSG
jgi:hypothetical protein